MAQALELVGFQGRIAYIGIDVGQDAPAKLGLIQSKELRITGSIGSPGVWPETLRFLAHSGIDLSPLSPSASASTRRLDALEAAHHPDAVDDQGPHRARRDPDSEPWSVTRGTGG